MTHPLQSLIDAPLADAAKINLPAGRRSAPRGKKEVYGDEIGCPKVSAKELRERREGAALAKLNTLFDYYATTALTAEQVATHMGLYRREQVGEDDTGKPKFERVLDVKLAEQQLAWRRQKAA